jgi:Na+/melibiose symporter-like transporter
MAAIPARASATVGGLVNLARGLGTALGVALPILALHLAGRTRHPAAGPHLAMGVLLLVAIIAMIMTTITTTASQHTPAATGTEPR